MAETLLRDDDGDRHDWLVDLSPFEVSAGVPRVPEAMESGQASNVVTVGRGVLGAEAFRSRRARNIPYAGFVVVHNQIPPVVS